MYRYITQKEVSIAKIITAEHVRHFYDPPHPKVLIIELPDHLGNAMYRKDVQELIKVLQEIEPTLSYEEEEDE